MNRVRMVRLPLALSAAIILLLLLSSCSSTVYLPYPSTYPLREEAFLSRDSVFTGRVPEGWFYSSEDTLAPSYLAWIVKEDFSAALTVKELHLDQLTIKRVQKEGIELLARISMAFQVQDMAGREAELQPRPFKMRNREYCGYEFADGALRKRVVVFAVRGRYYECVATPVKGSKQEEDITNMFIAQQAFLNSLTF